MVAFEGCLLYEFSVLTSEILLTTGQLPGLKDYVQGTWKDIAGKKNHIKACLLVGKWETAQSVSLFVGFSGGWGFKAESEDKKGRT